MLYMMYGNWLLLKSNFMFFRNVGANFVNDNKHSHRLVLWSVLSRLLQFKRLFCKMVTTDHLIPPEKTIQG